MLHGEEKGGGGYHLNCAYSPVLTTIRCSGLEARQCFPPHSLSHIIQPMLPGARLQEDCGSASSHPPFMSSLSPSDHVWDDSTPILALTQPSRPSCIYPPHLLSLFLSLPFNYAFPLSGEMSTLLYFALTLKGAFIRFILQSCEMRSSAIIRTDSGRCMVHN